jgi:hypothetical protein
MTGITILFVCYNMYVNVLGCIILCIKYRAQDFVFNSMFQD